MMSLIRILVLNWEGYQMLVHVLYIQQYRINNYDSTKINYECKLLTNWKGVGNPPPSL